jgi:DNA-binding LacI/PurR family transcriptional regulator
MTMAQLADLAGVSKVTVSRALNDSGVVTDDTRRRIRDLAAAHGYVINQTARSLSLKRNDVIAVVVEMQEASQWPDSEPYPLELLAGISERANAEGFNILLTTTQRWMEARARGVDGVVLLGQGSDNAVADSLDVARLPFAVWGADDGSGRVVVGGDNRQGGELAAARLLELGRSRLAFFGDTAHPELAARQNGFNKALAVAGAAPPVHVTTGFTFASGFEAGVDLLRTQPGVDGVFCGAGDICAMGLVRALVETGVGVPDAVSVIGYDDGPMSATFVPPLTTIRQDWRRGGLLLAEKVLDQAHGKDVLSEVLSVSITVRGT